MDKKFAIFDMDGTLVDSMAYWHRLAGEFLASKGVEDVPQSVFEKIKPMTMTQSAAFFVQEFALAGTPESIADEMNAMMDRHYQKDIPLKHGVKEYLETLHARGVQMCVASATAEPLMEACLTRTGVRPYFKFLLSCETVGEGKDKPDVYYEAAKRLGSIPAETAVYEDAFYALETAKNAGFYTVGVYDGRPDEQWRKMTDLADELIYTFEGEAGGETRPGKEVQNIG